MSSWPGFLIPLHCHKDVLVSALPGYKALPIAQRLTALNLWACKCTEEVPHSCLVTGVGIHIFNEV